MKCPNMYFQVAKFYPKKPQEATSGKGLLMLEKQYSTVDVICVYVLCYPLLHHLFPIQMKNSFLRRSYCDQMKFTFFPYCMGNT